MFVVKVGGAITAEWVRLWLRTLKREVPIFCPQRVPVDIKILAPFVKAPYPHCPVPQRGLRSIDPLVAYNIYHDQLALNS